jgi:hypothetical protein
MTEWEETRSVIARRAAAILAALEAFYVISLLAGLATDTDSETGESLAPVAAALLAFVIPLVIAFGATAWMLWRGHVWPAGTGRSRRARHLVAIGLVVLVNGALALQALAGIMTLQIETGRTLAGFVGLIVATASVLLLRESWQERPA